MEPPPCRSSRPQRWSHSSRLGTTRYEACRYTYQANKLVPLYFPWNHVLCLSVLSCQSLGQWSCQSSFHFHSHHKVASHSYRRNRCKLPRNSPQMSERTGRFHRHLPSFPFVGIQEASLPFHWQRQDFRYTSVG